MPEGHTIHRVANDHHERFEGTLPTVESPQGRFAVESSKVSRKKLVEVYAVGKHLFYQWKLGTVHVHLGLYGRFRPIQAPFPMPRPTVRMRLTNKDTGFDLIGPNRCELLSKAGVDAILQRLGTDPLSSEADFEFVRQRVAKSRSPMGTLLLNQAVFAGVGNIYRADALFVAGVHPERPGSEVSQRELRTMWDFLVEAMAIGKKYNRIINRDPSEVGKPRSRMRRDERLLVYKREQCLRCHAPISMWEQAARKVYACEQCQT